MFPSYRLVICHCHNVIEIQREREAACTERPSRAQFDFKFKMALRSERPNWAGKKLVGIQTGARPVICWKRYYRPWRLDTTITFRTPSAIITTWVGKLNCNFRLEQYLLGAFSLPLDPSPNRVTPTRFVQLVVASASGISSSILPRPRSSSRLRSVRYPEEQNVLKLSLTSAPCTAMISTRTSSDIGALKY